VVGYSSFTRIREESPPVTREECAVLLLRQRIPNDFGVLLEAPVKREFDAPKLDFARRK
jgi:hypothetical protein